jgi:hypothetical protein
MAVERADADTCGSRDGFQARIRAASTEHRFGGLKHALAVPNRIRPRLARLILQLTHADSPNLN